MEPEIDTRSEAEELRTALRATILNVERLTEDAERVLARARAALKALWLKEAEREPHAVR